MAKFDPNKPHGTISGEHEARFEQDGKLFNALGDELLKGAAKTNQNVGAPPAVKPVVDDQVAKQA